MKRTLSGILILIGLLTGPIEAPAQSSAFSEALSKFEALEAQGRYREAVPLARTARRLGEKAYGEDSIEFARLLHKIADFRLKLGHHRAAKVLYTHAAAIIEKTLGADHPDMAVSFEGLASQRLSAGEFTRARRYYESALKIREAAFGPDHPDTASTRFSMANLDWSIGDLKKAKNGFTRVLEVFRRHYGESHAKVADTLTALAGIDRNSGRYESAEAGYDAALAMREKVLAPGHADIAYVLIGIADLHRLQGRHAQSEPVYRRALEIAEKTLGADHPFVGSILSNLAQTYHDQKRLDLAEPLYQRALSIVEAAKGRNHPTVATALNNVASITQDRGRLNEAEELLKRSLKIRLEVYGHQHPSVGVSLNNMALLYADMGLKKRAEQMYKASLDIRERYWGPEHPHTATVVANLGVFYQDRRDYEAAETYLRRALSMRKKFYGADHPILSLTHSLLAINAWIMGNDAESLKQAREASAIARARALRSGDGDGAGRLSERKKSRTTFLRHVRNALRTAEATPADRKALIDEAFEAGQLAGGIHTDHAVARMALRFAAGDGPLARAIRERQDAARQRRQSDRALLHAATRPPDKRDAANEAELRRNLDAITSRIDTLDARIAEKFPAYAELVNPRPSTVGQIQQLLAEDEALLAYLVWSSTTYLFVLRRDEIAAHRIDFDVSDLGDAIANLRQGLSLAGIRQLSDLRRFNQSNAHDLYTRLVKPAEEMLEGVRHIFLVTDGPLQSLPFGILVTEEPSGSLKTLADYRKVPWLSRRYAMTTLPSASSLRALREFAKPTRAKRPFLGIGDPSLKGEPGTQRGIQIASLFSTRGVADVDSVRNLPSLPDASEELRTLATTLKAGDDTLILRSRATESWIKAAPLSDHRIIAFATHGLVAGELDGLAEAALVLTPPDKGDIDDDGLLTASEVARLKLDANWVILSACNTAAGDGTPGAEGLSGLAKAFFYAGTRTLLVSHWPVASDAAVRITTRMLNEATKPGVSRAEAHRRAMLSLLDETEPDHFAHPAFWAPFIVVGAGWETARP